MQRALNLVKMDEKSIGMCFATILTNIFANLTLSEVGNMVTIGVGLTTIVYNVYKIKGEKKK